MRLRRGRQLARTLALTTVLAACASPPPAELRERPNILLVVADDLALYEEAKARVLDADCAAWLEAGWGDGKSPDR